MKTCGKCGEEKAQASFSKHCTNADGYQARCKACNAADHRAFVAARPGYEARLQAARREMACTAAAFGDWTTFARLRLSAIRKRAQRSGIEFSLTVEDLVPLYEAGCALTSYKFSSIAKSRSPLSPSVDRIDSSKGYAPDNVRVVCHALNIGMNDWGFEKVAPLWAAALKHTSAAPAPL